MALPMLDEAEWAKVRPLLSMSIQDLSEEAQVLGLSLRRAMDVKPLGWRALALYRELTGFEETNVNALWHHRLSLYGPPCVHCAKPLRTPQAKLCAACGRERDPPLPG